MGVDAATGAAQDHKPNPVIVTLQPPFAEAATAKTAAASELNWLNGQACAVRKHDDDE